MIIWSIYQNDHRFVINKNQKITNDEIIFNGFAPRTLMIILNYNSFINSLFYFYVVELNVIIYEKKLSCHITKVYTSDE